MSSKNSWFPMRIYDKNAPRNIFFGPAMQNEKLSFVYPNDFVKKNEVVIWAPDMHKSVSLKSYEKAHQAQDQAALSKISQLGIPLGCSFGGTIKLA